MKYVRALADKQKFWNAMLPKIAELPSTSLN